MITALHATQTEASSFLSPPPNKKKEEKKSHKSDQYVIYFKQCFLSFYYKKVTVCLEVSVEFRETYKIPKQFHPILSAKLETIFDGTFTARMTLY